MVQGLAIQQSTLILIDYLFKMPHHRCSLGTCNSDSRYKDRDYMNGVLFTFFYMFPKPFPESVCLGWVKSCGRPIDQLNLKRIHDDFVKKNRYYRVCSKANSSHSHHLTHLDNLIWSMGSLNINSTHWGLVTQYGVTNFDNISSCTLLVTWW